MMQKLNLNHTYDNPKTAYSNTVLLAALFCRNYTRSNDNVITSDVTQCSHGKNGYICCALSLLLLALAHLPQAFNGSSSTQLWPVPTPPTNHNNPSIECITDHPRAVQSTVV
jgi:hypothetical protein